MISIRYFFATLMISSFALMEPVVFGQFVPDQYPSYEGSVDNAPVYYDQGFAAQDVADDGCCNPCATLCCESCWDLWRYSDYLTVGYTFGDGISYHRGYGFVGLFLTPFKSLNDFTPFFDGKVYFLDDGKFASSVGGGVRYYLNSWDKVVGVNVYYDTRKFHDHHFNQIGVGLELLGGCWDVRVNGYFPIDANERKSVFYDLSDCYFAARHERFSAWKGVDAEFGYWVWQKNPCNWFGLYLAAGPYYYYRDHDKHVGCGDRDTVGGRIRALARICDFIDISVIATFDSVWHSRVQGQIALNIPLDFFFSQGWCCNPCSCACDQVCAQPVYRNGIIVADHACSWDWNWSDASSGYGRSGSDYATGGYCPNSYSWSSSAFSSGFFDYHSASCSDCSSD